MATNSTPSRSRGGDAGKSSGKSSSGKAGGTSASGKNGAGKRHWVRRTLLGLAIGVLALLLAGTIGGLIFYNQTKLPNPNSDFKTNTTFIYYRDAKTKLGSLSIQNRQTIAYSEMPQSIKDAAVAAENRTFWTDRGISPKGIVRSAWTIVRGGEVQGGSTITQQYIKVMYLSSDRTMTRKLKELALAVKMGREVPKEQILGDYLNTIYFGRGAYGVQAAAKAYFNVDAKNLTVQQSAVLAAIINNPTLYDPSGGTAAVQRLTDRYHYVLDGMLADGTITQAQHDAASKSLPKFPEIPLNSTYGGTKGYLMNMVVNELHADGFDDSQIQGGGLTIVTTFDAKMQAAAVAAGQKYTKMAAENSGKSAANLHAAVASVQVGTGEVLASYGGDDYVKNSRNWATTARPAASTFKAWATVAALRNGLRLNTMLEGNTFVPPGQSSTVRNENGMQYGQVTLKKALTDSINTAFVDAVTRITNGPQAVIKAATDAGLPKAAGWNIDPRIALGNAEVSPLNNASGYATLANGGVYVPAHTVKQVKDASGKVLFTAKTSGKQTIENDVDRDVNYALESVVNQGTGTAVDSLGYPAAGKTGTAGVGTEIKSAWFVAYTKQISTAVMYVVGNDGNGDLDPYKRPGDSTFFGGTYPARTWLAYMQVAQEGLPVEQFPSPAYVNGGYAQPTYTAPATSQTTPTPSSSATSSTPTPSTSQTGGATTSQTATSRPSNSGRPTTSSRGTPGGGSTP